MTVIIDAGVALKWVLEEDGTQAARKLLLPEAEHLAAPDLLWFECAQALSARVRLGEIDAFDAALAIGALQSTPINTLSAKSAAVAAMRLAAELGQSLAPCIYLATALEVQAVFVTADAKFAAAARKHPVYGRSVRGLTEKHG